MEYENLDKIEPKKKPKPTPNMGDIMFTNSLIQSTILYEEQDASQTISNEVLKTRISSLQNRVLSWKV